MSLAIKLVIFAIVSAGIIFVSWTSFTRPRSYGFYRFFAFELILALLLLNLENWFNNPFSLFQIISWVLLICSIVLVAHGVYLLRVAGRPKTGVESTTKLVKLGAYKYIRHPLYSSLLFLAWGAFFKDVSLIGGILALLCTGFLIATAKVEEAENLRKFGSEYSVYMKTTKMFIPFLF